MEPTWPFEYFTKEELQCKCGCGGLPEEDFIYKVENLREKARFPFPVTSAFRCPAYNDRVSSTGRSGPHTTGRAIDIAVSRAQAHILLTLALPEFTGIGVNQKGPARFVHLDDLPNKEGQPRPTVWSY